MIVLDFGGQSAISTITVTSAPIASMAIETQRLTLRVGQTIRLSVSARDSADNAVTVRSISWSSDDQAVATVSSSGLLACLHGGGPCMRLASTCAAGCAFRFDGVSAWRRRFVRYESIGGRTL